MSGKSKETVDGFVALIIVLFVLGFIFGLGGWIIQNWGYRGASMQAHAIISAADCAAGDKKACSWRPPKEQL